MPSKKSQGGTRKRRYNSHSRSRSRSNSRSKIEDAQSLDYSPDALNKMMDEIRNSVYTPNKKSPPKISDLKEIKQNLDENMFQKIMKSIPERKLKSPKGDGAQEYEDYIQPLYKKRKTRKNK